MTTHSTSLIVIVICPVCGQRLLCHGENMNQARKLADERFAEHAKREHGKVGKLAVDKH